MSEKVFTKALIVDDREIDCFVSERMLKKAGFAEIIVAKMSADEAIAYLKGCEQEQNIPDVAFVDISMPGKDGFAFIEEFRCLSQDTRERCTIILNSTSQIEEDMQRMRSFPEIACFIKKPLTVEKLRYVKESLSK
jgi:CheY-like chemotaxis protein